MGLKPTEELGVSNARSFLQDFTTETWDGRMQWRLSGGSRWTSWWGVRRMCRVYISKDQQLIFTYPMSFEGEFEQRRWPSGPLTGKELGPLLEAIIFTQGES